MPGTAEVLSHEGGDGFVAAVLSHLRHLRAPCFAGGPKPARVDVGFAFVPAERRVVQAVPLDPDEAERRDQRSCLTPAPVTLWDDDYPSAAVSRLIQGNVLLEATFTAPDGPPELKAYARPRAEALKQAVLHKAQALRLSCLDPASVPVTVHLLVPFRLAESGQAFRHGFPLATDFRQLLAWISPAHRSSMPSSSQAMGCPFTLSLTYWQPDARNQVQQRGDFHPARQPLVDWFARATLAVPDSMLDDMYGSATLFRVPCYKIQSIAQANPSTNKE